jgi:uncharacterized membrane protein (UPF0127 family)
MKSGLRLIFLIMMVVVSGLAFWLYISWLKQAKLTSQPKQSNQTQELLTTATQHELGKIKAQYEFANFYDRQKIVATLADSNKLILEVVVSPSSITQGLGGREQIGASGMLFVFNQPRVPGFWMKAMKFDLDLIWLRNGQVVAVSPNVPRPAVNTPDYKLPIYQPPQPVDMVLEVVAGAAKEWGVKPGSVINFLQPSP